MPTQRSVATKFWTSLSLHGCSAFCRLIMLYCLTGPRSNIAGFFRISLDDCSMETGLTRKQITVSLEEARQREFLEWDSQTLWVWVRKRVSYEFPEGQMSDKQRRGITRILDDAPNLPIKSMLCEYYKGLGKPFVNGLGKGTVSGSLLPLPVPASGSLLPDPALGGSDRPSCSSGSFTAFYAMYPRKQGKEAARKAWGKLNPDPALQDKILAALQAQINSPTWQSDHGKFIPYPATWLNGKRWEDEIQEESPHAEKTRRSDVYGRVGSGEVARAIRRGIQADAASVSKLPDPEPSGS